MSLTEADGSPLRIRCLACAREDHRSCQGRPDGPPGGLCRCPQCWLAEAERQWWAARLRQDPQASWRLRAWGDVLAVARIDARTRKRRRRPPFTLPCQQCGRPVLVKRSDRRAVYCRDRSRCRTAATRARQRAAAGLPAEAEPAGPASALPAAPGPAIPAAPAPAADRAPAWRSEPRVAIPGPAEVADSRPAFLRVRQGGL